MTNIIQDAIAVTGGMPLAYQVKHFCLLAGISRTTFYELIKTGKIRAVKFGGRTLVPREEAERLARGEVR